MARWLEWLGERVAASSRLPRDVAEQELRQLVEVFATLVGPLRRERSTQRKNYPVSVILT